MFWAVRWYCRNGVNYRDLEQMMDERGVSVDHDTIYRWVQKYAPAIERRLRWQWRVANTDKAPTYAAALAELKKEGKCPEDTVHRQQRGRGGPRQAQAADPPRPWLQNFQNGLRHDQRLRRDARDAQRPGRSV